MRSTISQPLVSFYVNSYNRLPLLRNLLQSFLICNVYPRVEWIAVDYGSKDGSREFLREFASSAPFPFKLIIEDRNYYPTLFGTFRNEARRLAEGEYFVEVPEDQQFVCRRDWITECLNVFDHRKSQTGSNDISCIVLYGYYRWRLDKPNNARFPEDNATGCPYFVTKEKPYVDYHMMARQTYELIGPYLEPPEIGPDSPLWDKWMSIDASVRPEQDYQLRCKVLGLNRVFLKYPVLISWSNDHQSDLMPSEDGLIAPIWTLEEMKQSFGHLTRPVSSDELDPEHRAPLTAGPPSWRARAGAALNALSRFR